MGGQSPGTPSGDIASPVQGGGWGGRAGPAAGVRARETGNGQRPTEAREEAVLWSGQRRWVETGALDWQPQPLQRARPGGPPGRLQSGTGLCPLAEVRLGGQLNGRWRWVDAQRRGWGALSDPVDPRASEVMKDSSPRRSVFPGWKLRPREAEFLLSAAQQEHTFPSVSLSHLLPMPPAGGLSLPWAPWGSSPERRGQHCDRSPSNKREGETHSGLAPVRGRLGGSGGQGCCLGSQALPTPGPSREL